MRRGGKLYAVELALTGLATKRGIQLTMIATWKRQAIDGMAASFSGVTEAAKVAGDAEIEKLHHFLSKGFARLRQMIERGHAPLSVAAQCRLVSISRSSFYRAGRRQVWRLMVKRWRPSASAH